MLNRKSNVTNPGGFNQLTTVRNQRANTRKIKKGNPSSYQTATCQDVPNMEFFFKETSYSPTGTEKFDK
jgi:hypothetical protein